MFNQIFAFLILPLSVCVGGTIVAKVHRHNMARRRHPMAAAGD